MCPTQRLVSSQSCSRLCARLPGLVLILGLFAGAGAAADFRVSTTPAPHPKEAAEPIRALLSPQALRLTDGDTPIFDLWFVQQLPLKARPESDGKALAALQPIGLLGVIAVRQVWRDYRDDEVPPGLYTLRLGLQPIDGNHLGTAEYQWFALLVPIQIDTTPNAIAAEKPLFKASSKEAPGNHPMIISLRPPSAKAEETPKIVEPIPDHQSVLLRLPGKLADAGESAQIPFELVIKGKGTH